MLRCARSPLRMHAPDTTARTEITAKAESTFRAAARSCTVQRERYRRLAAAEAFGLQKSRVARFVHHDDLLAYHRPASGEGLPLPFDRGGAEQTRLAQHV